MRTISTIAGAALAALLGAPASAAPFTLFVYESPAEQAKRGDAGPAGKAYWDAYAAFGKEAQAAGIMRGGSVLNPGATARVVAGKGGVSEGAFAPSKLELGGYFIIDVATLDDAVAWARKLPAAATGAVEVRPALPTPGM